MTKYYLLIYSKDYYKIKRASDLLIVGDSNNNEVPLIIIPIDDEFIQEIEKLEEK